MARAMNLKYLTLNLPGNLLYTVLAALIEIDSEGRRPLPNLTHLEVRVTDWTDHPGRFPLQHSLPETFKFLIQDRCIAARVGAVKPLESLVVSQRHMEPKNVPREDAIVPAHLLPRYRGFDPSM